jgi:hypothetical protein
MKPKPLVALNHFTVPCAMMMSFLRLSRPQDGGGVAQSEKYRLRPVKETVSISMT